jgi:hypothetical protein
VVSGVSGIVAIAPPASASTSYHSYCDGYSSCQNSSTSIYLAVSCSGCETDFNNPDQKAVYTVRAQASNVILDKLTVTTSKGTSSIGASALKSCNYNNTCQFSFSGKAKRGDLYAHSGTTSTPKPTPKPTPKSTYSPKPVPKSTYSPKPVPKSTYSPKPVVKSSAPVYVKKTVTPVVQATLSPSPSPKPKVVPVAVATPTVTPEATVEASPSSSYSPIPVNTQAASKSQPLGTATIIGLGIATLALLLFAAMFIIRRRQTS